jgi:hypothetical protein
MNEMVIIFKLKESVVEDRAADTYDMFNESTALPAWLCRVLFIANLQLWFGYLYFFCSLGAYGFR